MFQHRIENGEELVQAGDERHRFCLSCSLQALVESTNDGIEPCCHDGVQI